MRTYIENFLKELAARAQWSGANLRVRFPGDRIIGFATRDIKILCYKNSYKDAWTHGKIWIAWVHIETSTN